MPSDASVPAKVSTSEYRYNLSMTMEHDLQSTIALLSRTPGALNVLLRDLPDNWTHRNEGDGTWSAYDVVGHLIHAERADWIPRARRILQHGESLAFDPFDREAQKRESHGKSLAILLDEFAELRTDNLVELRAWKLQPEQLSKRGLHPALGVVTLSQLLATWVSHDLTHLHQISRILAYQYREAVGPWERFLGVLRCNGHSAAA